MALESGPVTLPTKLSVAFCTKTLNELKSLCTKKMVFHQASLENFKTTFAIRDVREIEQYYPDPEKLIEPLAKSAHYYSLTLQGPIHILMFGAEELLKHFKPLNEDIDDRLASIQQTTFLLAQAKLNADKSLQHYLKITSQIEPKSPSEEHKIALEKNCNTFISGFRALSEIERICIEYFEITLQAADIFTQLDNFEIKLQELQMQLRSATRLEIPLPPRQTIQTEASSSTPIEPFEKGLEVPEGAVLDSDALAAQLANRLHLTSSGSEDETSPRWDLLLNSRSPSPLPVATTPVILRQYPPTSPTLPRVDPSILQTVDLQSEEEKQRLGL